MVQNLKWATAHLSRRLGTGLGARHSDTTCRRGARHADTAQAAWASGRGASGRWARGAQATDGRRAGRHGVGAQGCAARPTVRAGHGRPGRWMGAQAGPARPVLVHCAPGSVLARFLDPFRLGIFLSHQMKTVHSKINFRKKKIY